jgi:hypothetical protein
VKYVLRVSESVEAAMAAVWPTRASAIRVSSDSCRVNRSRPAAKALTDGGRARGDGERHDFAGDDSWLSVGVVESK